VNAGLAAGWALAAAGILVAVWLRLELDRRARLVARACHEARGPLTAALLGLQLLSRVGEAAPGPEAVELELVRAGRALEDLEAARRGDRAPDRPELVDVAPLVRAAVEAATPVAAGHGVRLELGRLDAGARVRADPLRLLQACANLLVNGAEHGAGPVRISARRVAGTVRIAVDDAGPGLPAGLDALVAVERRGRRGHGLGVAAEVAARHGGRLAAAPSARGTRLVIELPAAP
jgi:signal transduction histidine kinase